jgi:hypothetical protein
MDMLLACCLCEVVLQFGLQVWFSNLQGSKATLEYAGKVGITIGYGADFSMCAALVSFSNTVPESSQTQRLHYKNQPINSIWRNYRGFLW